MAPNLLQIVFDLENPTANPTTIHLQLGLARAASPDPSTEPREGLTMPREAGEEIFELGQFNLELPLFGLGALGEDIEDEARPVDDLALEGLFQIPLLRPGQILVEDDQVHSRLADRPDLLDFPRTDEVPRVENGSLLEYPKGRPRTRRGGKLGQLIQRIFRLKVGLMRPLEPYQEGDFLWVKDCRCH
jgi:hypothetical protein